MLNLFMRLNICDKIRQRCSFKYEIERIFVNVAGLLLDYTIGIRFFLVYAQLQYITNTQGIYLSSYAHRRVYSGQVVDLVS